MPSKFVITSYIVLHRILSGKPESKLDECFLSNSNTKLIPGNISHVIMTRETSKGGKKCCDPEFAVVVGISL